MTDDVRRTDEPAEGPVSWGWLAVVVGVGLIITMALTAVAAEIHDDVVEGDGITRIDQPVLDKVLELRSPTLDAWVTHFTDLGSTQILPFLTVAATGLIALWWRSWTPVLLMAIATAGGLLMTVVGKSLVGRERPDEAFAVPPYETSASFPSGHTMNTWIIAAMVAYLVIVKLRNPIAQVAVGLAAILYGVAMGLSRVYLGHHWMTDVAMSWVLGTAWVTVVIVGHRVAIAMSRYRRQLSSNSTQNGLPSGSASTTP